MPTAYLIDLTRLVSRIGRGALTGIDRVELAYLAHLYSLDTPLFALIRSRWGFLLLGRQGCGLALDLATGATKVGPEQTGFSLRSLRPLAIARRPRFMVSSLLRKVPRGGVYFNVGHSNLTAPVLTAARRAGLSTAVMIQDTIPLDYPHLSRVGSVPTFAAKVAATARCADVVIHLSRDARAKTNAHFEAQGHIPQGILAPLGVVLALPQAPPITPTRPYFVALGTIEPRKNLKLLFDIWQAMIDDPSYAGNTPQLVVIGNKGWAPPALFDQMVGLQKSGAVLHFENLSDGAVSQLLKGAIALLFPSLAEGFGLPPLEAAGLGTQVVASDLPVIRESCADFPVYLAPTDSYAWREKIKELAWAANAGQGQTKKQALPTWADHFKAVLTQSS